MTKVEFNATKVRAGVREDCIATLTLRTDGVVELEAETFQEVIDNTVRDLSEIVTEVLWRMGEDHAGDSALFFETTLRDKAAKGGNLMESVQKVEKLLRPQVDRFFGKEFAYFNYRSVGEGGWKR